MTAYNTGISLIALPEYDTYRTPNRYHHFWINPRSVAVIEPVGDNDRCQIVLNNSYRTPVLAISPQDAATKLTGDPTGNIKESKP